MLMATACQIGEEMGDKLSANKARLEQTYIKTFGIPFLNKNALGLSLKRLAAKRKILKKEIGFINKQMSEKKAVADEKYGRMLIELQEVEDKIKQYRRDFIFNDKKNASLRKIHDLILGRLSKYQHDTLYSLDPETQFPVIFEYIQGEYTLPFTSLRDLPAQDLASIANKIEAVFKTADKKAAQKNRGELTAFENTVMDPALAMMESDVSTLGFQIINKSRKIIDDANSQAAPLKRRLTNALSEIDMHAKSRIELNDSEKDALKVELVAQVHRILDGEERHFKPMPVIQWDKKGRARYTFKSKEVKNLYNKILRDNIDNDWNEGGAIQKIEIDGRISYFIPIREPGTEVFNAYEVPYQVGANGRHSLLYPMTRRNQQQWMDFFASEGLASHIDIYGNRNAGMMKEGRYRATENAPRQGQNKKGKEITVRSYSKYEMIDDQAAPISQVENLVTEARAVFKEIREVTNQRVLDQKGLMTEAVRTMANHHGVTVKKFMASDELNAEFMKVTGLDSLNLNFSLYNGRAISMNQFFNEMHDYVPYRYSATDMLIGAVRARDEIATKIANKTSKLKALNETAGVERGVDKIAIRKEIKELSEQMKIQDDNVNVISGVKQKHQVDSGKINETTKMNAVKHRGTMMEPMPLYRNEHGLPTFEKIDAYGREREMISHGRRTDFGVFTEYIDDAFRQIEQNDLKIDLLHGTLQMSKATNDFVIDHVKASMGRLDVKAGFFNLDYSDSKWAKMLTGVTKKFWGNEDFEVTEEMVYRSAKFHSMVISGSLLGYTSALNNYFQRLSAWIEGTANGYSEAKKFIDDYPVLAEQIADAAGVTDTLNAMADALMGASDGAYTKGSGMLALGSYAILKLDKQKFLESALDNQWWRNRVNGMIARKDPSKKIDLTTMRQALSAIHDATHGAQAFMAKNELSKLSPKQLKSFTKKLETIMEVEEINKYVGWKLNGGFLAETKAGTKLLGFQPSELEMRKQIAVQGVLEAEKAGMIPSTWRETFADNTFKRLTHPNAIAYSRLLVYNTLFGLSPAYLPKMFRGAWGTFLWKFKPYQWHQARNEMRTMENWWRGVPEGQKTKELVRIIGLSVKESPYLPGKPDSSLSNTERKMARFIISRGLISLLTTGLVHTPMFNWAINAMKYKVFNRQVSGAVQRGGESVLVSGMLQLLLTGVAITGMGFGDDDERGDIYQGAYRYFLPIFANVLIDTFTGEDPTKALQIYSKGAHTAVNLVSDIVSD